MKLTPDHYEAIRSEVLENLRDMEKALHDNGVNGLGIPFDTLTPTPSGMPPTRPPTTGTFWRT
jgi:hypothetical protein